MSAGNGDMAHIRSDSVDYQQLGELTVLDISDSIAGAYCTKLLADFGADVLKVEPPTGDASRSWNSYPHDGSSSEPGLLFSYLNANKRGLTLDVATGKGRELLRRLLPHAALLVESCAPDRATQVGLDRGALGGDAAQLIWLSITPFGQFGPYANYQASDLVIQAVSGWMHEGGDPECEPLKTGGAISEYITGVYGAIAAMAAWLHRQATGIGQYIDLSAFEAVQSTSGYGALAHSVTGVSGGRSGQLFPFAIVPCADGYVGINVLTPTQWEMLCAFMRRTDLVDEPRFATPLARREHSAELTEILQSWALEHTREELFAANEWRVPITTIPTVADLLDFPQHKERGYFVEQDLGPLGVALRPSTPFQMSAARFELRRSAPSLGEHNEEIYCGLLGLSAEELDQLRSDGIA